jgi:hypothetical protein
MVDVVWNDGSASGDFTSQTQGDVVFRVLAQKLFPVAWLWFVLVIIQYVGFPNGNIFHFRVIRPCFA